MVKMDPSRYRVEIPDLSYWKRLIACQDACPVQTDARGYIQAIAHGDYERGYIAARAPNPLASVCGRICGAPCEAACRRGRIDKPIAIRALKRFVSERFGVETYRGSASSFFDSLRERTEDLECNAQETLQSFRRLVASRPLQGKTVAVVGSGPAGLASAHDLALMGASVTLFEMENEPGGMLALGVPDYRLRREVIQGEVEVVRSLGVRMVNNSRLGHEIELPQLRRDYDAVIIAVGAKRSRRIPIRGSEAEGVLGGVDFLRAVALGDTQFLGQKVVVIGGGNVAYDVARTVVRQIESDVSRVALRQPFVKEVHLCCLESLDEMPADDVEILEGDEEGVIRHNSYGPHEILHENGKVSAVRFKKCLSVFDAQKRFAPVFDESELLELEADTVILSVGQALDLSFLEDSPDIEVDERGLVRVDTEQMTTAPGVFLAGDVCHGTKLLIDAEASGKKAARAVFRYLSGRSLSLDAHEKHEPLKWERESDYEKIPRTRIPTASPEARRQSVSAEVELGYDEEHALLESRRCLDCGVNTIFDSDKCILCGGCADVCPERCLKLVSAASLEGQGIPELLQARYGEDPLDEASAIIKDEDRCIRCGLCSERCPTGAITMERFTFDEVWSVG